LTPVTRGNDDFSSNAVKWMRAIGGNFTYFITDNFSIFGDLKYDLARFDNIVKAEIKYSYEHKLNLTVGLEMLKTNDPASYWSHYRADDTIYSSLGFYF
jgi:lipopolysaccharide assembly outer membrane protein LptD (OstA)